MCLIALADPPKMRPDRQAGMRRTDRGGVRGQREKCGQRNDGRFRNVRSAVRRKVSFRRMGDDRGETLGTKKWLPH